MASGWPGVENRSVRESALGRKRIKPLLPTEDIGKQDQSRKNKQTIPIVGETSSKGAVHWQTALVAHGQFGMQLRGNCEILTRKNVSELGSLKHDLVTCCVNHSDSHSVHCR